MQPSHVAHSGGDFQAALFLVCSLQAHVYWRLSVDVPVIEQQANNGRWKLKKNKSGVKRTKSWNLKLWKEAPTNVPQMATFLRW